MAKPLIDPKTGELGAIDPETGELVSMDAAVQHPAGLPAGVNLPGVPKASSTLSKVANPLPYLQSLGEGITGAGKGAAHTIRGIGNLETKLPGVKSLLPADVQDFLGPEGEALTTPHGTAQGIGHGAEQIGEFLLPGGAEEKGAAKLAELAPKLGKYAQPLAKVLTSGLSAGTVNAAQGGSPVTGALMGAGGQVLGQGLKAAAPALAETALKVRGNQRLFGRTVGDAILNDTGSAVRPENIGKNAEATIARLSPQLDAADQASATAGKRGTLLPARTAIADTIQGHAGNRAMKTAGGIQPVADFLRTDQLTGLPLAEQQAAPGLRSLKRGLNEDFIHNWTSDQPPAQKATARQAYGLINQQLHGIAPETEALDQRISSLFPVQLQGQRVASGAPLVQRLAGRVGAHTGALAGAGIGGTLGYREGGGVKGAIAGGLTGLVAPELIASPEGQMIMARTLNKANALRPLVGSVLQADRKKKEE